VQRRREKSACVPRAVLRRGPATHPGYVMRRERGADPLDAPVMKTSGCLTLDRRKRRLSEAFFAREPHQLVDHWTLLGCRPPSAPR